jgi:hypothetical protein
LEEGERGRERESEIVGEGERARIYYEKEYMEV